MVVDELLILANCEVRLRHRERVRLCASLRDRVLFPESVSLREVRYRSEGVFRVLQRREAWQFSAFGNCEGFLFTPE